LKIVEIDLSPARYAMGTKPPTSLAGGLPETIPEGIALELLPTSDLEAIVAEADRRKTVGDEDKRIGEIRKILQRRYKGLVNNLSQAVLPRVSGTDVGLPRLPNLPVPPVSVGDANLLMTDVPIVAAPYGEVLSSIARELIHLTGGLQPVIGVEYVNEGMSKSPRVTVRWDTRETVSADQLHSLLQLLHTAYEQKITGYKENGVGWAITEGHLNTVNRVSDSAKQGIYMGPGNMYTSSSPGLFVYRKFKAKADADVLRRRHPVDWLSGSDGLSKRAVTFLELKDGGKKGDSPGLAQDSFLMLVVQISYLLRHNAIIESAPLWVAIYRELNKVGTKALPRDSLWGTESTLTTLERVMLLPYQRPEIAERMRIVGESVLLVGVPGVGKTLLEHYLMSSSEYNVIFAAVDNDALSVDLAKARDGSPSPLLMRVDRIRQRTTLPVILIIDDIDAILQKGDVVSKFLNMMQGIRQKGFLVVASTNHPEKIDPRLLEPGRLSKIVHVSLPSESDRHGVLMAYLGHLPFRTTEERESLAQTLAKKTAGWSHRFLWELTQDASRYCAYEVADDAEHAFLEPRHFDQAMLELNVRLGFADLVRWDERIRGMVRKRESIGY